VHRWYQPGVGRYTRPDPIGLASGWNLYGYVWQNPAGLADPLGLATFMCTRPLQKLPDAGRKSGPESRLNPLYHQYICIRNGEVTECGGLTGPLYGHGRSSSPQDDFFTPNFCEEVEPDNLCIERCLTRNFGEPRPFYGLAGPGTNCQEWADDRLLACRIVCRPRPPEAPDLPGFPTLTGLL
jgi:hypothetical protein